MTTGSSKPTQQTLDDTTVFDVDVHISYTKKFQRNVARRMDRPYRNYVDPDLVDGRVDFRYSKEGIPKTLGGKRKFELTDVEEPETIAEELVDGFGVDRPLLNVLAPVDGVFKSDRAVEEMKGINDVLVKEFLDENDDFLGAISVGFRRPEAAAEEIRRWGDEKQVVGAFVACGQEFQEKPLGDPKYDVVYDALAETGITPVYHVSNFTRKCDIIRDYQTGFSYHVTGPPWSIMYTLASLMGQGVPAKFPELDFVMLEGGIGWLPFYMARLNREYDQWHSELPLLEKSPEEYLRDQFYFSTQPLGEFDDPSHMVDIIEIIGADSLVFSTDYPHYDFDNPTTIDRFFRQLSDDDREKILHRNAEEVLLDT